MNLKTLRYFLTVTQAKTITKAAEMLHITQPTLSRQLILLEETLGVQLFVKQNRVIELTDEGKLLKKRAREILDLTDLTMQEILNENSLVTGVVSIGFIDSLGATEIYEQMRLFHQNYPNVNFDIHSGSSDDLLHKMEQGSIDLCLLLDPVDTSDFNAIRLSQNEEWGVIVSCDDKLAEEDSITIKKLTKLPLVLPMRPAALNEIENWFGKNKYKLNIVAKYGMVSSAIQSLENGLGYPICLYNTLLDHHASLKFLPLMPEKHTQSVIVWRKNRSFGSAAELFVKTLFRHFNPSVY